MRITIWSSKGGVGKSSLGLLLHERLEKISKKDWGVITNDIYTDLSKLPKNKVLKITTDKDIPIVDDNIIYDMGGYVSDKLYNVIKNSDLVIIPTIPSVMCLNSHIPSVREVEKINKNIIQVISKTKNNFDEIKDFLISKGLDYPVFELRHSLLVSNLFDVSKNIEEQLKDLKVMNPYTKKVLQQIDDIANAILKRSKK